MIILLILCFIICDPILGFEKKIDCLLKPEPYQSLCLDQFQNSSVEAKQLDKNDQTDHIKRHGTQSVEVLVGVMDISPFKNGFRYGIRYGFQDHPWGYWRLGFNSISANYSSGDYLRRAAELIFEQKFARWSLLLGVNAFEEEISFEQSFLTRTSVSAYLGAQIYLWRFKRFQFSFELGVRPPLRHDFKLSYSHDDELTHELLMQLVNKLDQAWPISAQIGMSYLFD